MDSKSGAVLLPYAFARTNPSGGRMKRDMELVRKILFALEALDDGFAPRDFSIEGHSDDVVGFHVHLMKQAGLLEASDVTTRGSSSPNAVPRSITWEGYEFLDLARDNTRWKMATDKIKSAAGSVSLAVLTQFLTQMAKEAVGVF